MDKEQSYDLTRTAVDLRECSSEIRVVFLQVHDRMSSKCK